MDWQTAFNITFAVAGGSVGLYVLHVRDELKTLRHDLKNNSQTLSNLRAEIPAQYATTPALDKAVAGVSARIGDVFTVLSRLEDKMDRWLERR